MSKSLDEQLTEQQNEEEISLKYEILELKEKYAKRKEIIVQIAEVCGLSPEDALSVAHYISFHHTNRDEMAALEMMRSYHLGMRHLEERKQKEARLAQ